MKEKPLIAWTIDNDAPPYQRFRAWVENNNSYERTGDTARSAIQRVAYTCGWGKGEYRYCRDDRAVFKGNTIICDHVWEYGNQPGMRTCISCGRIDGDHGELQEVEATTIEAVMPSLPDPVEPHNPRVKRTLDV